MPDNEAIHIDMLACGDQPSLLLMAMVAARALKDEGQVSFMVDAVGRVHLMPPATVQFLKRPRLSDDELHQLDESKAITILAEQGASEAEVMSYLKKRDAFLSRG